MNQDQAIQLLSEIDPTTGVLPPELMPKTKESSVSTLGVLPMPYYNSLRPKTVNDVFESPTCSIAVVNREFGETHLRAFMVNVLNDLINFFNVGKSMSAVQVAQTADLVIEEFYYLKPDDLKLCFTKAKKGAYGKLYDRIDGQIILEWLRQYDQERCVLAEMASRSNAHNWDIPEGERTSDKLNETFHKLKMFDFDRKFQAK